MKKLYSILGLLLLLATTAYAQTVTLVCSKPTETFYPGDNDLYVTMYDVNENYAFCFDIVCAPGDSDIVDGQTYTLTDMLDGYSYGYNSLTSSYINFASVSFVRNAGAYTVNITDEDSVHYLLTYTPPTVITQFVDSVSITMDNGRKNTVTDYTSSQGVFQLIGYDMTRTYNMYLALYSNQIAGTYTIDDIYSQYTSIYVNQNKVEVNTIRGSFTVAGDADTCSTYVELVGVDSILYKITFEYPGTVIPITPIDTVDVLMNNGEANAVSDYTSWIGEFMLQGYDLNNDYGLSLYVYSDQLAGAYTQDDVDADYSSFTVNGNEIEMYEINNFTVVGDADTCSTYIEILGEDSVLYRITFEYPGYVPPIIPIDTVVVAMNDVDILDYTSYYNVFMITGQSNDYLMSLAVLSDQIAGTYTENDLDDEYSYLLSFIGGDTTYIDALRYNNITITGTAKTTVNAHIEMISTDTVLYIINMNYVYNPIVPVDTVDIVLDDPAKNFLNKEPAFFQMWGDNGSYAFEAVIMSEDIAGIYTDKDIYSDFTNLYVYSATDTTNIYPLEFRSIVVVGDTSFFNAHFEMIGTDTILYRINFIYPGAVAPTDTVVISFTNPIGNFVFDETATNGSFSLVGGADQNYEYGLALMVNSTQFAGTYTQASVAALELVHATATDTADIMYSEIRDFTVTGDANNCSTYIEMVGSDGIFYKMTFTYTGYTPPTEVVNTEIMFVVYSEENTIVINGAEGETMAVYDMTGKMIVNTKATSTVERVNVGVAGVYVVRIGEQTLKVVVK